MKYLTEFRDPELARWLLDAIAATASRRWTLMEVCGGQTHAIIRHGLDQLLADQVEFIHGPGCPVCVTPLEMIDRALAIAARPEVIFCSFGDMLRVPGSGTDLFTVKARGGDVRVVYSPLDAVHLAEAHPDRQVVFFAVGFETTAPANALAAVTARRRRLANFSMLVSHVLVPPAMSAVATAPGNRVEAFLAAGHVCTVMGIDQYEPLVAEHRMPIVVTGFEPLDLLDGVRHAVEQLEAGRAELANAYERAVQPEGNPAARKILAEVFTVCDRAWRGIGTIPDSGWRLADAWRDVDAEIRFDVGGLTVAEPAACRSGAVLQGLIRPPDCAAFGTSCTPRRPLGATMVSAEGACAAYFQYRRLAPAGAAATLGLPGPAAGLQT
ncbi:hydrogenase formation protein HypD [Candidatus Frankia alpina]|uniref:Hydrogenase formation protein HypD n=1 Tax=Candidatus Frankia alpina TaxID=2699483 RepID=A0A4S5ENU7_9ACTN|nr:hydrogenase formation protein HypD [Candidatus Frankia alpina]THJ74017.1 hydrogenase formation protein HypD [Candidatus Frankia alpina]